MADKAKQNGRHRKAMAFYDKKWKAKDAKETALEASRTKRRKRHA